MRTDPNVMDIFFRHKYLNYTLTWKLRKYPWKRKTPFPNHHHFWDIQVLFWDGEGKINVWLLMWLLINLLETHIAPEKRPFSLKNA